MKNVHKIYEAPMTEVIELMIEEALLLGSGTDGVSSNGLDPFTDGGDAFGRN